MQYHENTEEAAAARAFENQSSTFDNLYSEDLIIKYKRETVRNHILGELRPGAYILELNCGTGEDAIFFEKKGFTVLATDVSEGMISQAERKALHANCENLEFKLCSFNSIDRLNMDSQFDHIFSNFAGLNCTPILGEVLMKADKLLKPGGKMTLVLLPVFCLWEFALLFKGKWKTAFRRFKHKGAKAKIKNDHFSCFYYNPSYVTRQLKNYELKKLEGLCTIVPPSYIEGFGNNYPRLFAWLKKKEKNYSRSFLWRSIGDYYIITIQKPLNPSSE
jgi:ubiquinone/menaquinone biosynthesis C-methylase UbiE